MDKEFRELIKECERQLFISSSQTEGHTGIRVLSAFQCIKCSAIFDDIEKILEHVEMCDGVEKIENYKNE